MRVLLLTPPMTQINTPYPATAYLTGFLRERGVETFQADPALLLLLRLLSREGLREIRAELRERFGGRTRGVPRSVRHFLEYAEGYLCSVERVVRFLQGGDPTLAHRLCGGGFIPRGPRFDVLSELDSGEGDSLEWAFGSLGLRDRAQYFASLYVDDLADVIREGIDPKFELSRYGEKLAVSAHSFDPLLESLLAAPSLVDRHLDAITLELMRRHNPQVVGITVPFPGNVYGAFRMAQGIRRHFPDVRIALGGGYVNTELRRLGDPRVFDFVDYVTLDDGERPFLCLLGHAAGKSGSDGLFRTFVREKGEVVFRTSPAFHDIPFKDAGTPTYDGLPLGDYLSVCELLNPMHRLWTDGRWNKLTLAHGCYWKKCSFCDVTLDYIGRYEDQGADRIVDRMEKLVAETGQTGFHFVDEAAPPKALVAMARRLIEREVPVTWWGNIRFEKTFTAEVADLLARSGCVAVSGGLEVAADRLLKLMNKGVTVEQVARVTHAFSRAGIMVHAYLMYGFPTQTVAETVDSLERVRQLFEAGCLQSAYWHRFSATVHSPIGKHPERFGVKLLPVRSTFASNDVAFEDESGIDHGALHPGLKRAVYNFMHGMGLEQDVRSWFDQRVPKSRVPRRFIRSALEDPK